MKLEDPKTIRMMWVAFIAILVVLVVLDLMFAHHHTHFTIDAWPGFYSWFGFGTCVIMVVASKKVIGWILSKPDTYYDEQRRLADELDQKEHDA